MIDLDLDLDLFDDGEEVVSHPILPFDIDRIREFKPFPLQRKWMHDFFNSPTRVTLFLGARKYGKSIWITQVGVAQYLYNNPLGTVVICCSQYTRASNIVKQIASILKDLGIWISDKDGSFKTKELIETKSLQHSCMAIGANSSRKSIHVDWLIMDDPLEAEDEFSQVAKKNVMTLYEETINLCQRVGVIAQYISEDDLITYLESLEGRGVTVIRAWRGSLPALDEEESTLKAIMSPRNYARNYLGYFLPPEDTIFSFLNFSNDTMKSAPSYSMASLDIAFGGGDYTALSIAYYQDKRIYVLGFAFKESVYDILPIVSGLLKEFKSSYLCYEKNNDHSFSIERQLRPLISGLTINRISQRMNKNVKIQQYISQHKSKLYFCRYPDFTKEQDEYKSQFINYPLSAHDDAPDSLANLFFKFSKFFSYNIT